MSILNNLYVYTEKVVDNNSWAVCQFILSVWPSEKCYKNIQIINYHQNIYPFINIYPTSFTSNTLIKSYVRHVLNTVLLKISCNTCEGQYSLQGNDSNIETGRNLLKSINMKLNVQCMCGVHVFLQATHKVKATSFIHYIRAFAICF